MVKKWQTKPTGRTIVSLCLAAALIFGVAGWAWWSHVYNDPERVFWSMLSNSLSTASVTRHTTQPGQGNSLDQVTRLNLGAQSAAHGLTTITQLSTAAKSTVLTESLGTTANDYARYLAVDTSQRDRKGKPLNFNNVLNVWGKSQPTPQQPNAQFLNSTILNVIPFAPLNAPQRQQVLQTMRDKNIYTVDYGKTQSRTYNGRNVFVYSVSVSASAYVASLKTLAQQLGITQLDRLNPADYASDPPQQLEITVDKLSHQLLTINYPNGARQEAYSGYGLQSAISVPANTLSIDELQKRLQSIQ